MKMRRKNEWDLAKEQGMEKARGPWMALPEKHMATITTGPRKECSPMGIHLVLLGTCIPGCGSVPGVTQAEHGRIRPSAGPAKDSANIQRHGCPRVGSKPGPGATARWTPVDLPQTAGEQSQDAPHPPPTTPDKEGCGCNF